MVKGEREAAEEKKAQEGSGTTEERKWVEGFPLNPYNDSLDYFTPHNIVIQSLQVSHTTDCAPPVSNLDNAVLPDSEKSTLTPTDALKPKTDPIFPKKFHPSLCIYKFNP